MTNKNLYIFVGRLSLFVAVMCSRSCPLKHRRFAYVVSLGFFITFIPTAVLYSQTVVKHITANCYKNEINKYDQREHPGNDQLPSTRRGLHSILNNPAKEQGGFLDRTKGNLLFYYSCFTSPLMGMKSREGMFNKVMYPHLTVNNFWSCQIFVYLWCIS